MGGCVESVAKSDDVYKLEVERSEDFASTVTRAYRWGSTLGVHLTMVARVIGTASWTSRGPSNCSTKDKHSVFDYLIAALVRWKKTIRMKAAGTLCFYRFDKQSTSVLHGTRRPERHRLIRLHICSKSGFCMILSVFVGAGSQMGRGSLSRQKHRSW